MSLKRWTKEGLDAAFAPYMGEHPPDSPQGRKRARILRAATELFLTQGYRRTSVDDVARKAEVAKGTVYLYFENKGALLTSAIALEKKELLYEQIQLLGGDMPGRERLRAWLVLMFTAPSKMPLSARLLSGDAELAAALEDIGSAKIAERQAEGREWIAELFELAAPGQLTDAQKRERADMLIAMGYAAGTFLNERVRGGRSLMEFAGQLADTLIDGALPRAHKGKSK